jgi:leucyl/phenylalanyl-tRNA--protein transferase
MIPWLSRADPFPPISRALSEPNGLLAAGADLSASRLLAAYRQGIFPWFTDGQPILWWSPNPRMVLFPGELKVSRSLSKLLKRNEYSVRADTAFREVVIGCARPRGDGCGTWITEEMVDAYLALHQAGYAHSIETWIGGELKGGLYGVALGGVFFGESMFYSAPNASKIAFVHLVRQLERWRFGLIDCQMATRHLASFGARQISRHEFMRKLGQLINYPGRIGVWELEDLINGLPSSPRPRTGAPAK